MTERDLGNSFSWWIGEVVDVYDPDQSGRVRVRVYGRHDDKANIPDDALPWALPMQPITSAAHGKAGTAPLGLVKGSKVKGYWADKDQQSPIIMGSFGKAGDIKNSGTTTNGTEEIDINTGSIPSAATNQSDPTDINPYSKLFPGRVTINDINKGLKTVADITRSTGIVNKTEVDSKLKQPSSPTTASQNKTNTADVINIIRQADPENIGASLKNMVPNYANVRDIMGITSIAGQTSLLSGGISGALGVLSGNFNIGNILPALELTAASGLLPKTATNALYGALNTVQVASITGNLGNLNPISAVIPQVSSFHPTPTKLLQIAPPTYAQQFYDLDKEPYPGYIEWRDPITQDVVHTLRGNEPHYASAQDHIMGNSAAHLGSAIGTILKGGTPSVSAIAGAITGGLNLVQGLGIANILGNGINLNNIASLASHFLPSIGGIIGQSLGGLSSTFLSPQKVGVSVNNFTKNQAMLALKKQNMKTALNVDHEGNYQKTKNILSALDTNGASQLANLPIGSTIKLATNLLDGSQIVKTFTK
jgi:hypothetical protein